MFIDNDAASSQCRAKACGWNLKDAIGELDGVVSGHDAFMLNGENPIQVQMRDRHKRRAGLGCRDNEFAIELRDVVASQKWFASSTVRICRMRSSCGNQPCQVPKFRSLRPRA